MKSTTRFNTSFFQLSIFDITIQLAYNNREILVHQTLDCKNE